MTFQSLKSDKFQPIEKDQLCSIVGGGKTGGDRVFLGNYRRQIPCGPDANGNTTTDWEWVTQAKYRVFDADDTECNCFLNEREEWGEARY